LHSFDFPSCDPPFAGSILLKPSPGDSVMAKTSLADVVLYLRKVCAIQESRTLPDGVLLERFARQRDQAAFSALVDRHGPMVFGVGQRVLGESHAAEDVFQATFLVLVRRARSLGKRKPLGGWLYAVAQRIAAKAKKQKSGRRERERRAATMAQTECLDDVNWQELRAVLDEEIARLPEKYRTPLVLCYFQGRSHSQAAQELDCPKTSLTSRLERGRELLRERLVRRGISLSAGVLAAALAEKGAAAPVGAMLVIKTVKAAMAFAAGKAAAGTGITAGALTLAQEALIGMVSVKAKVIVLVLALGVAVGGAGLAGHGAYSSDCETPQAASGLSDQPKPKLQSTEIPKNDRATDFYGDPLPDGAVMRLGTTRLRHGDLVHSVRFFADGKSIASADTNGIHIWDAATGKRLRSFSGEPKGYVYRFADTSADCRFAAFTFHNGGDTGYIEIFDLSADRLIRTITSGRFPTARFSPDGKTLAVIHGDGEDQSLELWDTGTGEKLHQLDGHRGEIHRFLFSADGKLVVTPGQDKSIRFWDVATGKEVQRIDHSEPVGQVALSQDGKTLAATRMNKQTFDEGNGLSATIFFSGDEIILWDVSSAKEIRRLKATAGKSKERTPFSTNITHFSFSPDCKTVISSDQTTIYWWDVATGRELSERRSSLGGMWALGFSPDGSTLVSGRQNSVQLWDIATGKKKLNINGHLMDVHTVVLSPDGKTYATGGTFERVIRLWNAATGEQIGQLPGHELDALSLAFTPDSKKLISEGREKADKPAICVWDLTTGKELLRGSAAWFTMSPDGKVMLTGDKEKFIQVWDLASGKERRRWEALGRGHAAVEFSADGKTLFAWCEEDKKVRTWDAVTGKLLQSFPAKFGNEAFDDEPQRHAFSPDGKWVAFRGNVAKYIQLYDMATGKAAMRFPDSDKAGRTSALAFSPDGRMLVSGDWTRGRVHLWELATAQHSYEFNGHQGRINRISFSADGSLLLTASADTTALAWDLTGRLTGSKKPLSAEELEARWADLSSDNATKAQQAVRTLVALPDQAVALLGKHLKTAPSPDAKRIEQLITAVDSDQFKTREEAMAELENMGDIAAPALQTALASNATLELKQRLQRVLDKYSSSQRLRTLRAIQVLEYSATPASRALLERLAQGHVPALLTREAESAVRRRDGSAGQSRER
jgi:RNA polymerase sigma factor (sigma-70 family)